MFIKRKFCLYPHITNQHFGIEKSLKGFLGTVVPKGPLKLNNSSSTI
jgi:hypothetical protein